MSSREERRLLSLPYRLGWRIRWTAMHVFGPAQLGETTDPHARLDRERRLKLDEARRRRDTGTSH